MKSFLRGPARQPSACSATGAVLASVFGSTLLELRETLLSAEILRIHPDEPQPDRIDFIVSCLRKGDVVAIPTDTFYGLAVDPVNLRAV